MPLLHYYKFGFAKTLHSLSIALCFLLAEKIASAQTVLKLNKPIDKSQWFALEKKYFRHAYGTVTLQNSFGDWEQISAEKPTTNSEKSNWKLHKAESAVLAKRSKAPSSSNNENFIDPGCESCSIIIFPTQVSLDTIQKAKEVLASYMELQIPESNTN